MNPMLVVDGLEVVYNDVALAVKGVSLEVPSGQVVAVLGGNGAGKTSMLRAISGLLSSERGKVVRGDVTWEGRSLLHLSPSDVVDAGVVQVLEGRRVFEHLSVEENLLVGGNRVGSLRRSRNSLDLVYGYFPVLRDRRRAHAGYLSGGEQQMLAIGRALLARPRLLLLDEPSLGLAPLALAGIMDVVASINRDEGVTVLLVEQNAQAALRLAAYGYIMENGRVVLDGTTAELRQNEDVAEFYLGLSSVGESKSYKNVKSYRRRKRWIA